MWGTLGGSSGTRLVVSAHFTRLWKIVTIVLLYMYAISSLIEVSEHCLEPILTCWLLICTMPSPELLAMYPISVIWTACDMSHGLSWTTHYVSHGLIRTARDISHGLTWIARDVSHSVIWTALDVSHGLIGDGLLGQHVRWWWNNLHSHEININSNIPILTIWRVKWVQILLYLLHFWHPGQKINLLHNLSHYVTFD